MYNVSDTFTAQAEALSREIFVKALFNEESQLTGNDIIDMTIIEAVNASDGLSMGKTISSQLTMSLKMPDPPIILKGGSVEPAMAFVPSTDLTLADDGTLIFSPDPTVTNDGTVVSAPLLRLNDTILEAGEYCPLGKFYITEAISAGDSNTQFSITAYDGFCKTEVPYTPSITMPNTAAAILEDIATQCHFSLAADITYPEGTFNLHEYTCREYIGYFAGLQGKNARFNRNGNLTFVWYTQTGYSVGRDHQYMSGLKRLTVSEIEMRSITSGTSENVMVAGAGTGISFDNPFMTQEILDNIFANVGVCTYLPAQLKWRGHPAIEAGDIIAAEDKEGNIRTIYVMEQTLKIGGGFHSEIKCYGKSEAAINFSTSPQTKKLQQVYTKLQDALQAATTLLNGANGGVFEIVDSNGDQINDGWIIHSVDGQKFIKANVNGIGITKDGGATYQEAMTVDGINASAITTGQMNAQRITVGDASLGDVFEVTLDDNGHPLVIIGSSANDIKQKQTSSAIEFVNGANETLSKFSIAGAEWADMQQIAYCGFAWTKSESTGNVRFTKVGGAT